MNAPRVAFLFVGLMAIGLMAHFSMNIKPIQLKARVKTASHPPQVFKNKPEVPVPVHGPPPPAVGPLAEARHAHSFGGERPKATGSCQFSGVAFPPDAAVLVVGAEPSTQKDSQTVDVVVAKPGPALLILGSMVETTWTVTERSGATVLAILAEGPQRQSFGRVPSHAKTMISSMVNRAPCGVVKIREKKVEQINELSQQLYGRPLTQIYSTRTGGIVISN
ncbi:MAG: hypothetical protein AB7F86_15445 [Bdellovibrionales bacterium]